MPTEFFQKARTARAQGELDVAQAFLAIALAHNPGKYTVQFTVFQADLLWDGGHKEAAWMVLEGLQQSQPGNFWPAFHLAQMAFRQRDLDVAWRYLGLAKKHPLPNGAIWADLLEADVLIEEGRYGEAEHLLETLSRQHPENTTIYPKLVTMAERRGDPVALRRYLGAALARDPTKVDLQFAYARTLIADGRHQEAVEQIEGLRQKLGDDIKILMFLVQICNQSGMDEEEQDYLLKACDVAPYNPALVRHLFAHKSHQVDPDKAEQIIQQQEAHHGAEFAHDLRIRLALQSSDFPKAYELLTAAKVGQRDPSVAHSLALALFGTHRYKLGMRYLRFCLRRWPTHQSLWMLFVMRATRQCYPDEVEARLADAKGDLPDHLYWSHKLSLAAYYNDLDAAIESYAKLREIKRVTATHRTMMGKLIYTKQDLSQGAAGVEALFAQIGNPGAENSRLLHRGGLVGLMTLELTLECQALKDSGPYDSLQDWLRARPESTIAAIRVVDDWRATQGISDPQRGDAIPQRIFQYWDNPNPPDTLFETTPSWANVPGYEHVLMDRIHALRFLRQTYGQDWLRAFQLAQDASQESDLLRLCLLAHHGGIWADVDDYLYGDLGKVLGAAKGLILYREPMGGAVGNNFMAAPPGHPVVLKAADLAKEALLRRDNENAWNKTGPGLLTRAMAQVLTENGADYADIETTVLDWQVIGREISTHTPMRYKKTTAHWENADRRNLDSYPIWNRLQERLQAPAA